MKQITDFFDNNICFIIAEVAQAHDGSLGMAHSFIESAAKAGADAIKFQTHIADAESTTLDQWRVNFSYQDATRFDYWKRMEFTESQWAGLKKHAEDLDMIFMSSPFSNEAVDLLERIGIQGWKIASGELTNLPMLEKIYRTKKPVIVSSGMSQITEMDTIAEKLSLEKIPFAILQCTSSYPTPPEKVGLNVMLDFKKKYNCPVGLSDHSGTIFPALAGATMGMNVLELHLTLSKQMFGPDVVASIDPIEFEQMVKGIRFIEKMNTNPVLKDEVADTMKDMRGLFNKSIVAASAIKKGTILNTDHLAFKKPGIGISASQYKALIGKVLNKDVAYNYFFTEADFI